MTARLVFLTGSRAGSAFDLTAAEVTLGRHADSTIVFSAQDVLVSAVHATISWRDGRYVLRDEGSRNGTYVGTGRITEHTLEDGDLIQLGPGGPAARFGIQEAGELAQTLDPKDLARASQLIALTKRQAADATRTAQDSNRPLTTTRELAALTYLRTKRTRRALVGATAGTLLAIVVVFLWQQRGRADLQQSLTDLSVALAAERESRSALEQDFALMQRQADSLRRTMDEERQQLIADRRIDPSVLREYSRGVALIVFSYGYGTPDGSRLLRYAVDGAGGVASETGPDGRTVPGIALGGSGPPLKREGTATGFLVDEAGWLVTNRHVAVPWENDQQLALIQANGLDVTGRFLDLRVYFPPGDQSFPAVVEQVSTDADVALLRVLGPGVDAPPVPIARAASPAPGDPLVLIGYPTGAYNLLFRVSGDERAEILTRAGDDLQRLVSELSARRLIQPLITDGIVSDTTPTEIIHSAGTTGGGSGGPLIDLQQRVVAVHYASVQSPTPGDPFRTQRGVRIRFAWEIAPASVRRTTDRRD
jgi:S1-C subfamily serine protease